MAQNLELFKSLFKGREDVFAIRWERDSKSAYTPAYIQSGFQTIGSAPAVFELTKKERLRLHLLLVPCHLILLSAQKKFTEAK